jgi:16S rRNA (guanine(527)-N(7))-methyltransferase RsmG
LFLEVLPPGVTRVADLGSGAGIPGIPLKIVKPTLHMALIEARQRRASFLKTVLRELTLGDVEVVEQRVPGSTGRPRTLFDAVVARCAGDPISVAEAGLGLVRKGGNVIIAASPTPRPGQPGRWVEVRGRHFLVVSEGICCT